MRSPQTSGIGRPAQPNPAVQVQLDRVQTFCVYASELVDTQREDINRVSAAVERIESELKSFRELLGEMNGKLRAIPRERKPNGIASEEIDLLTSSVGEIGRKTNEIDTLKLELAMMKSKVKRLENALHLQNSTSPPHRATTDNKLAQASLPHSPLSSKEHSQPNVPVRRAGPTTEASAAKVREGDSMPRGKKRRHRSPSEEATTSRYDNSQRRTLGPPVEASHPPPISLRPRRPEQLRPYLAAATLLGEDEDGKYMLDRTSPNSQSSPSYTNGVDARSGRASVRKQARSTVQPRKGPLNSIDTHLREQDELGMDHTDGHRISLGGAINGISSIISPNIKAPRRTKSRASDQAPNQMKEDFKITKVVKVGTGAHYTKPMDKKSSREDQRKVPAHDDPIQARERALDEEWTREYGLGG
ncbi:MAG: hypothetical protein M1840_008136 [Geoglossum simile]|nr:MAG: hypothetical protein M1840_008136 [Geoglossum simile]